MHKLLKLSLVVLLVSGMFSTLRAQTPSAPPAPPTAPAPGVPPGQQRYEHHPEIYHAIKALEKAKEDLRKADHDFGGHREAALAACDQAINELKQALQYDHR